MVWLFCFTIFGHLNILFWSACYYKNLYTHYFSFFFKQNNFHLPSQIFSNCLKTNIFSLRCRSGYFQFEVKISRINFPWVHLDCLACYLLYLLLKVSIVLILIFWPRLYNYNGTIQPTSYSSYFISVILNKITFTRNFKKIYHDRKHQRVITESEAIISCSW